MDKITEAVNKAGGHAALARILGVNPSLVSQWTTGRLQVAAHHCREIERACKKAVTVHDLRPDVFGPVAKRKRAA